MKCWSCKTLPKRGQKKNVGFVRSSSKDSDLLGHRQSYPKIMNATPASKPLIRAQSGVSVMSSLFLETPSLIRFAAVKGTKGASMVQLAFRVVPRPSNG